MIKPLVEKKEFRFVLVGCVNTAFGYGLYAFFIYIGLHYLQAFALAFVLAVINSYFLNRFFTFRSKGRPAPEFIRFVLVYLASFFLGSGLLYLLIDMAGMGKYAAGVVNMVFGTVISWLGHNYFSFRGAREK